MYVSVCMCVYVCVCMCVCVCVQGPLKVVKHAYNNIIMKLWNSETICVSSIECMVIKYKLMVN